MLVKDKPLSDRAIRRRRTNQLCQWRIDSLRAKYQETLDERRNQEILNITEKLRARIESKSDAYVSLCFDRHKKQIKKSQALQTALDTQQFFNEPDAVADLEHWSRTMPAWSLDEAVALSFGKAPGVVDWENIAPHIDTSCFAKRYARVRDMAL